jgi:hypothetical protein
MSISDDVEMDDTSAFADTYPYKHHERYLIKLIEIGCLVTRECENTVTSCDSRVVGLTSTPASNPSRDPSRAQPLAQEDTNSSVGSK